MIVLFWRFELKWVTRYPSTLLGNESKLPQMMMYHGIGAPKFAYYIAGGNARSLFIWLLNWLVVRPPNRDMFWNGEL
jgi:hypothetical protein